MLFIRNRVILFMLPIEAFILYTYIRTGNPLKSGIFIILIISFIDVLLFSDFCVIDSYHLRKYTFFCLCYKIKLSDIIRVRPHFDYSKSQKGFNITLPFKSCREDEYSIDTLDGCTYYLDAYYNNFSEGSIGMYLSKRCNPDSFDKNPNVNSQKLVPAYPLWAYLIIIIFLCFMIFYVNAFEISVNDFIAN